MSEEEKRIRIAEIMQGLENIKDMVTIDQYKDYEVEVKRKINNIKNYI